MSSSLISRTPDLGEFLAIGGERLARVLVSFNAMRLIAMNLAALGHHSIFFALEEGGRPGALVPACRIREILGPCLRDRRRCRKGPVIDVL